MATVKGSVIIKLALAGDLSGRVHTRKISIVKLVSDGTVTLIFNGNANDTFVTPTITAGKSFEIEWSDPGKQLTEVEMDAISLGTAATYIFVD
jgi:hypothetical protein